MSERGWLCQQLVVGIMDESERLDDLPEGMIAFQRQVLADALTITDLVRMRIRIGGQMLDARMTVLQMQDCRDCLTYLLEQIAAEQSVRTAVDLVIEADHA